MLWPSSNGGLQIPHPARHLTISFEDLEETETLEDDFLLKKWCFPTRHGPRLVDVTLLFKSIHYVKVETWACLNAVGLRRAPRIFLMFCPLDLG